VLLSVCLFVCTSVVSLFACVSVVSDSLTFTLSWQKPTGWLEQDWGQNKRIQNCKLSFNEKSVAATKNASNFQKATSLKCFELAWLDRTKRRNVKGQKMIQQMKPKTAYWNDNNSFVIKLIKSVDVKRYKL
jgi:hypothetical protein